MLGTFNLKILYEWFKLLRLLELKITITSGQKVGKVQSTASFDFIAHIGLFMCIPIPINEPGGQGG